MARQPEHLAEQQRQLGRYLAALREAAGLYQTDIARAVPCHRTTVAHAEAGSQLPASDFWEIADRLVGAHGALIARYDELIKAKAAYLADQQAKRRARAQTTVQQMTAAPPVRPKQACGDGSAGESPTIPVAGSPTPRRETLKLSLALAVIPAVFAEEESAATVHAITNAHRRLDGTTPSRELVEPVAAHLRMASQMQARSPYTLHQAMAAAVSEVAGLAGWLYWDMQELGSARRHYRIAAQQAQRASGDPMLTVYMLGSLASFVVVQDGAADEGIALIKHAVRVSEGERPATADAWLASLEAVAYASAGDDVQTWRALDRAEAAVGRIAADEPPPWPWVFPFDTRKVATHRLTCAVRLRCPDVAYAAAADLSVSLVAGHRKQGALALLDLACAHVQALEVEEGLRVATTAIDLAATTRSERVLSRARQFRRTIPATTPPGFLRDFDEHLHIANTREWPIR